MTLRELLSVFPDTEVKVLTTRSCFVKGGNTKEVINKSKEILEKKVIKAWIHDSSDVKGVKLTGDLQSAGAVKRYEEETEISGTLMAKVEILKKSHLNIIIDMEEKYR